MRKSITKSPRAYNDLIEIACYIAQDNIEAADRFLIAVEETFDRLAKASEIGSLCPFKNPLAKEIRVWPVKGFKRYLIFYRSESNGINVVRILHGARDWQSLFNNAFDNEE
jgi:toxin ParE1/3/4